MPVDQSAHTGWVPLGEYTFNAMTDHYVRVNDNTGELPASELSLVADMLKISRTDPPPPPMTTGEESSGEVGSEGSEASGGGSMGGTTEPAPTSGYEDPTGGSSGSDGTGGPALPMDYGEEDGCGCTGAGAPGGLVVIALLWRRRRKV